MVMETPSPQCVGREFVRQYYTLLHEAPLHLHRFYSHNSSFVHGGVEKPGEEQAPVMGQADIHKKIVSLNFHDCHAKIRQVDSQATVGTGVVVQVTGELSNNGQPMRRFMQTFVLAPQSPKKYYVHNDIFRYQDEVFHEDDSEAETMEEDSENEIPRSVSPINAQRDVIVVPDSTSVSVTYFEQQVTQQPSAMSNGSMHTEDIADSPLRPTVEEEPTKEEEPIAQPMQDLEQPKETETEPEAADSKPFSWAALASKNTPQGMVPPPPPAQVQPPQKVTPPVTVIKPADVKPDSQGLSPQSQRGPRPLRDRGGPPRDRASVDRPTVPSRNEDEENMMNRPQSRRFPDSQQLFVGNLPHNTSDQELKDFFSKFGKIEELRINTKGASGGKLPNFGFVVFDSLVPVQQILQQRPIMFRENHRLNVEEKKQRDSRAGSGSRGPRGERGSSTGRGGPVGDRGGRMGRGGMMGGRDRMGSDNRAGSGPGGGRGGFSGSGPRR